MTVIGARPPFDPCHDKVSSPPNTSRRSSFPTARGTLLSARTPRKAMHVRVNRSRQFRPHLGRSDLPRQHPVDGALADPQPPRDFGLADAFGHELADLVSFASRGWRPALVLAFRLGRGNPFALPLQHDLALELGD